MFGAYEKKKRFNMADLDFRCCVCFLFRFFCIWSFSFTRTHDNTLYSEISIYLKVFSFSYYFISRVGTFKSMEYSLMCENRILLQKYEAQTHIFHIPRKRVLSECHLENVDCRCNSLCKRMQRGFFVIAEFFGYYISFYFPW